jgi:hypothetical protein
VVTLFIAVAALAFYLWLYATTPDTLSGASTIGLWYGIIGSGLMLYAGALSALRRVPSWWWLGSRKVWMRGHIWLSLLSIVFILCHSGFRLGGPLERALWIVFALVIVTGIYGLVLQQFMPRLITTRFPTETPYEQMPHFCDMLRHRADVLADKIAAVEMQGTMTNIFASQAGIGAKLQFQKFFEEHIRRFLLEGEPGSRLLANPAKAEQAFARLRALPGLVTARAELTQMETLCDQRRELPEQEHLYHWLHAWLLVHVPLSVILLVLGVAHAVASLYY